MNSKKNLVIVILALALIGCGTFAWNQHQENVSLRTDRFTAAEKTALEKRAWDAEQRARALETQLAAARSRGGQAVAANPNGGNAGGRAAANPANNVAAQLQGVFQNLITSPQLATMQKAAIGSQYAAFAAKLGLSPDQTELLNAAIAGQQSSVMDILAAAGEQGVDPRSDPRAFQQLFADAQAQSANAIKEVIGEDGYAALQDYNKTAPQRTAVNQIQQQLIASNIAMTAEQSEQLIGVLAANTDQAGGNRGQNVVMAFGGAAGGMGGMASGFGGAAVAAPISPAGLNAAAAILSPEQMKIVQQTQQASQAQQQVQAMMLQALTGQGQRGGGGGGAGRGRQGGN